MPKHGVELWETTDCAKAYPLGKSMSVTVGRKPSNAIVIGDSRISGKHLEFTSDEQRSVRVTCHSTNGTFLNGERLTKGEPREIRDGDIVSAVIPVKATPDKREPPASEPKHTAPPPSHP